MDEQIASENKMIEEAIKQWVTADMTRDERLYAALRHATEVIQLYSAACREAGICQGDYFRKAIANLNEMAGEKVARNEQ